MKFALALAAVPFMAAPALAGPYVMTKSELKFTDSNYKSTVNQARLGYETKVGDLAPYVEVGGGGNTSDGGSTKGFTAAELGTKIKLTKQLSAKAKVEALRYSGKTDWKAEVSTKFKF